MARPSPTRTFVDESGSRVHITPFLPGHKDSLVNMYVDYAPEHRSQGLPPVRQSELDAWLSTLAEAGRNFVACIDDRVVCHAVYTPVAASDVDYVVFVDPAYQDRGIGRVMIQHTLQQAAAEGFDSIVSHVDRDNEGAIHLYESIGFERGSVSEMSIEMGIELQYYSADDFRPDEADVEF